MCPRESICCKPTKRPQISAFCPSLSGCRQGEHTGNITILPFSHEPHASFYPQRDFFGRIIVKAEPKKGMDPMCCAPLLSVQFAFLVCVCVLGHPGKALCRSSALCTSALFLTAMFSSESACTVLEIATKACIYGTSGR